MRHRKFNKSFIVLLFTTLLMSSITVLFNKENIGYAKLSPEDAQGETVSNFSYGYNVTAGRPMYDHFNRQNRILRPVNEVKNGDSLADHITKTTEGLDSEAVTGLSESFTDTMNQSKNAISGGINAKISVVNFDVDAKFDRQTDVKTKYRERYETYYKRIEHSAYVIDGKVDLRDYLDTNFENVLLNVKTENDAYRLFDDYGTHLLTSIVMGGLLEVCNYQVSGEASEKLSKELQIGASIDLIMKASKGGNFNYDETIMQEQNKGNKASTYKCHLYGGTKDIADLSLSQLFQYHQPSLNVPGEFEYTRWTRSIERGEKLSILGIYPNTKTVPVWDLFPSSAKYNEQRLLLLNAYKKRCGTKYNEFLAKYPEKQREENLDSEKYGTADIAGYSLTKNNLTTYYEKNPNAPLDYYAYPGSTFSFNYEDTIPEEKKEWRVIDNDLYVSVEDNKEGTFKVLGDMPIDSSFTVGLYSGNILIESFTFKVNEYEFSGGSGTVEDPYKVSSMTDYKAITNNDKHWNSNFELIKDINFAGNAILPIGKEKNPFTGSFNGNNCTLYNFTINTPNDKAIGLFAYNKGEIKNLKLGREKTTTMISYIEDKANDTKNRIEYAGGLVAYNQGKIYNCRVDSITVEVKDYFEDYKNDQQMHIGSLVGHSTSNLEKASEIRKCSAEDIMLVRGILLAKSGKRDGGTIVNVGGFIGSAAKTTIENCYANIVSTVEAQTRCFENNLKSAGFIAGVTNETKINTCILGQVESIKGGADSVGNTLAHNIFVGSDDAVINNCFYKPFNIPADDKTTVVGCTSGITEKTEINTTTCSLNDVWHDLNDFVVISEQTLEVANPIIPDVSKIKKFDYYKGRTLNLAGLMLNAKRIDGSTYKINTFTIDTSAFDNNKLDIAQDIKIDALSYSTRIPVTVRKINVVGIAASQKEKAVIYPKGTIDTTNLDIYYILENGQKLHIDNPKDENSIVYPTATTPIFDYDELVFGQNKVQVRLGTLETLTIVNVEKDPLVKLDVIEKPAHNYRIGDEYSIEGMKIQAQYESGNKTIVKNDDIEVIGNKFVEGENIVSLSYEDYDVTYEDTVNVIKTEHTVIFKDHDGSEISKNVYGYGETINVPNDPVRANDNTYSYKFAGWDKPITTVTGDVIYTATYSKEYIDYTVKFVNEDGTLISTHNYHYGDKVVVPNNPTKKADNTYTYLFAGWDTSVVDCDGNKTYTATYNKNYIDYTITFVDENGDIISQKTYHYGDIINQPLNPTKPSDKIYNYIFAGWDKEVINCDGNKTYKATYNKNYINYTITFVNDNGDIISQKTYHYGEAIVLPNIPTKDADKTYTYTFTGWDTSVVNCDGNKTYTATYNKKYIDYTIKFVDEDGSTILEQTYHYGDVVTAPKDPTKDADKTYTYTFAGWDNKVVNCDGSKTYTATYNKKYIDYTIKFVDEDGTTLLEKIYHYGDKVIAPTDPHKASDNTYTYTFTGWNNEVINCDGDKTYTATYSSKYIDYTIKFVDEDGKVISTKTYHYGDKIIEPANPSKASDKTYTYTFAGWDTTVVNCDGNKTYTAKYNKEYIDYTIKFVDEDGKVISETIYHYGDEIIVPENPTKASDKTYTYTFAGWDNNVINCDGNKTYTATYSSKYIDYTIKFVDENGTTILEKAYHYGDVVTAPSDPTKANDKTYTYTFTGWDTSVVNCDGDKTYTATYSKKYIEYTVKFVDSNGNVILEKTYHYGDVVTTPENPEKKPDNVYTYTFTGWDNEVVNCDGDKTYTATYSKKYIDYTIKFVDEDGTVILEKIYHFGDKVIAPTDPHKASDKTYTYTFTGWNNEVINCDGDKTYTATYSSKYIDYTIKFVDEDGTVILEKTYHYGDAIIAPANPSKVADKTYTYTFTGWDNEIVNCDGNKTYTAKYNKEYIEYTVIFKNYDGTVIKSIVYHYGDVIDFPTEFKHPANTDKIKYEFTGWGNDSSTCIGNAEYKTQFKEIKAVITIIFKNEDGSVISTNEYQNGDVIIAPDKPSKPSDLKYNYIFKGWDKEVGFAKEDTVFTAVYTQEDRLYKVTFKDDEGNIISENQYKYNETINAPTPTKDATKDGSYKFTGWDKEILTVTGDVTYTAQFEFIPKEKSNVVPIVAGSIGGAGVLGLAIWGIVVLLKKRAKNKLGMK